MTQQQHESRWSLNHTGNRVLLGVVVGLAVVFLCGGVGLSAAQELVFVALVAGGVYLLVTTLNRRR